MTDTCKTEDDPDRELQRFIALVPRLEVTRSQRARSSPNVSLLTTGQDRTVPTDPDVVVRIYMLGASNSSPSVSRPGRVT
jgi:hypothetical protein